MFKKLFTPKREVVEINVTPVLGDDDKPFALMWSKGDAVIMKLDTGDTVEAATERHLRRLNTIGWDKWVKELDY